MGANIFTLQNLTFFLENGQKQPKKWVSENY
jgi:hypothetical protein